MPRAVSWDSADMVVNEFILMLPTFRLRLNPKHAFACDPCRTSDTPDYSNRGDALFEHHQIVRHPSSSAITPPFKRTAEFLPGPHLEIACPAPVLVNFPPLPRIA